jgi:hypothetical protein
VKQDKNSRERFTLILVVVTVISRDRNVVNEIDIKYKSIFIIILE